MATIQNEIARAKALNGAKVSTFKGVTPRSTELNTLHDGDVINIPADYVVLEQEVNNAPARKDASGRMVKPTAKYIFVNVTRDDKDLVVAFYPTAFWKRRQTAIEQPKEDDPTTMEYVGSGTYVSAGGDAAEHVQGFADLDEALKDIAGKDIVVNVKRVPVMPYGATSVDVVREESICDFNFKA